MVLISIEEVGKIEKKIKGRGGGAFILHSRVINEVRYVETLMVLTTSRN